jgi:hypothetical protein
MRTFISATQQASTDLNHKKVHTLAMSTILEKIFEDLQHTQHMHALFSATRPEDNPLPYS